MTLSARQIRRIAAIAGVNILLVVGGWMALISPQRHDAAKAAAKTQLAQNELADLLGTNSKGGPTTQPVIHTADIYALDTALPSQPDQPDLLFELDRVAAASRVKIIGLSPQTGQAMASGYTVVQINLQLAGTYYHLTDFLGNLRTLVSERRGHLIANGPLFSVTSGALAPTTNGDAPATVQLDAYYYGVTAGATAPASTTDTTTTTSGS